MERAATRAGSRGRRSGRPAPVRRRRSYVVYVIELDRAVCTDHRSNVRDGADCRRVPVYVGETGKTAEQRFEDHKRGGRIAAWAVENYGLHLRPSPRYALATREEAKAREAELGKRLTRDGFCVYGGH